MPTWPSANKAVTTYTDQGTDRLADARPEINKTISNVNDIIDTFNISSPSDGDLLQYSTSTGKWEQIATTSVGTQVSIALLTTTTTLYPTTAGTVDRRVAWTETFDNNSIVTLGTGADTGKFTLNGTGLYLLNIGPICIDDQGTGIFLRNETTSSNVFKLALHRDNNTDSDTAGSQPYILNQTGNVTYSIFIGSTVPTSLASTGTTSLSIQKLS